MDLMELLDELRVVGQNGLRYADDPYDEERYDRILKLVSQYYGKVLDVPSAEVRGRFSEELGHVTPKVGAEAGILDSDGDLLLMRRSDDGKWCLPCGWVDPDESPAEAAVRETKEETGLDVEPVELVDVYHEPPGEQFGPHGRIAVLYLCERKGGTLDLSHEGEELRYWSIDDVPAWHKKHVTFAGDAKRAWVETGT